ncbi:MAG: ferritin [Bacteroidetes bacterium]|nr:ferritin [Bacteroidota bacterium]MCB0851339.1 ferritin [Bacteroidota bacterium]
MISKKMEEMIVTQYHKELFSAYQYFAMCSYFLDLELDGFANFFRVQAEEELMHAMKQFDYLHEVDGKMTIGSIEAPENEFNSILEVFQKTLEHEQYITKSIHQIVKAALDEADFATHEFFQWFVKEQVEEESTMRNLIGKLKLIDGNTSALYLLNEELLRRQPEANPGA